MAKSILSVYFKKIRRQLPICRKYARDFYKHMKVNIEAYLQEFPNATYDDLIKEFGTPESLANNYIEMQESEIIRKQVKRKSSFIAITVGLSIVVSVGIGGYYYCHTEVCKSAASAPISIYETATVYEYINSPECIGEE